MATFSSVIATADKANKNGRIYTREALDKVVASKFLGAQTIFGIIGSPKDGNYLLADVAFQVSKLYMEGNDLIAEVTTFDEVPEGKRAAGMIEHEETCKLMTLRPCGTGKLDENGVVYDYKLEYLTLVNIVDAA